jgi:hypothetical protein
MATQLAHSLKHKGWNIQTLWTPSHVGIIGNEMAGEMAQIGAKGELDKCPYATKSWRYTEARKRYLEKWRMELGMKHSPNRYLAEHRNMSFTQARALYRVFCNRTPIDRLPQKESERCSCREQCIR